MAVSGVPVGKVTLFLTSLGLIGKLLLFGHDRLADLEANVRAIAVEKADRESDTKRIEESVRSISAKTDDIYKILIEQFGKKGK